MSVEPVVYDESNVVKVNPGDVIPPGHWILFAPDSSTWVGHVTTDFKVNTSVAYAPSPILDLPPEPKEVEFGEAMRRIIDGENLLWDNQYKDGKVEVHFEPIRNRLETEQSSPWLPFLTAIKGTFYELPAEPDPQPRAGLKWWEAIEAIRGTKKKARRVDKRSTAYTAHWSGIALDNGYDHTYEITDSDLDAEWEIVE